MKLNAETHHSRIYIHDDIHMIYGHKNGTPRFVNRPVYRSSLQLGFEPRKSEGISQTGRQRIPERRNNERSQRFQITFWNFQNFFLKDGGCVKFDMYRAKLKGESYVCLSKLSVSLSLEKDACT